MKNHKDEVLDELAKEDDMIKEDIASIENNLMTALLPNTVGPMSNAAIGIQLEEYLLNRGNKQNK